MMWKKQKELKSNVMAYSEAGKGRWPGILSLTTGNQSALQML